MKNLKMQNLVLGMVQTNCYLLQNPDTKEMILVDPADQAALIEEKVTAMGGKPVAIFLTHGHFDHIMAAKALRDKYQIPVYAQEAEREVLEDSLKNLSGQWSSAPYTIHADHLVKDQEQIQLLGTEIVVLHTPGHTTGSSCYYFPKEKILLSGDTLFAQSVGRTDLPTSNARQIKESIRKLLQVLPADTEVYPGHGEMTTIGYEMRYNPFA